MPFNTSIPAPQYSSPGQSVPRTFSPGQAGRNAFSNNPGYLLNQELSRSLLQGGLPALPQGFNSLMDIIMSRGQTSPYLLNRQLLGNKRTTEAERQAFAQSNARKGPMNSGVLSAIDAAIGASGADREAAILANEAATQEARQRSDMGLLFTLIQLMSGEGGKGLQKHQQDKMLAAQQQAALIGALGTLGGSMLGGPAGGAIGGAVAQKVTE